MADSYTSTNPEVKLKLDEIPDIKIGFTRFVSGMIMHVLIDNEIKNGLTMMKYAINHHWKFRFHRVAVLIGFLQFSAMFLIALANYMVITISASVIDVAKDFTALIIISEFDDIFSKSSGSSKANEIVTGDGAYDLCFKIETTTSLAATSPVTNVELEYDEVYEKMTETQPSVNFESYPRQRPTNIRINFFDRHWENKVFFCVYKFFRIFHVTVWFYFFPFLALMTTYAVPIW